MFYISNSILFYNNNYFFLLWNLHTFQIIRGGLDTHSCHRFLPASPAPSEVKGFCLRHNHTWTKRKQKQQNIGSWEVKELKQLWEKHRSNLLWATKPWKGFEVPDTSESGDWWGEGGADLKTEGLVECPYESTVLEKEMATYSRILA